MVCGELIIPEKGLSLIHISGMVINNLFEATIAAMQSGVLIIFWLLIGLANQKEGCV